MSTAIEVGDVVCLRSDYEAAVKMTVVWVYGDSVDVGWHDGNLEYSTTRVPSASLCLADPQKEIGFQEKTNEE